MLDIFKKKHKHEKHQDLALFVSKGKPHKIGLASLKEYEQMFHPLVETRISKPNTRIWKITDLTHLKVEEIVMGYYSEVVKKKEYFPGRFGDWIKCSKFEIGEDTYLLLDYIGQAAWNKASIAADLGIFVKSGPKHYFISIIRKNPPAAGTQAILGGFTNVGQAWDSGIYTMLREADEESNLKIEYSGNMEELRENYEIAEIPVIVNGFEKIDPKLKKLPAVIHYITLIPTSEQERNADGTKRVYATFAYALYIDVGQVLVDEEILKKVFEAGDDAEAVVINNVTKAIIGNPKECKEKPEFGMEHHGELFEKMVIFYKIHLL